MKLLFLTPQLPYPPRQGATIRNFNLLAQLAQRHSIDLITFAAPGEELRDENVLHTLCQRIATLPQPQRSTSQRVRNTFFTPLPDMALRLESAAMHEQVQRWTQETAYDIVQIEGIEMAQYGRDVAQHAGLQPPCIIFDDHNCEYLLQQRTAFTDLRRVQRWPAAGYSLVQWQKLRRYERIVCRQAAAVVAVSDADRKALLALDPALDVTVVSNGIDLEAFQLTENAMPDTPDANAVQWANPTLVFTGKMDYRPNIDAVLWFGHEVLPLLKQRLPALRFQIVGMNPHSRLDELRSNTSVDITGAVDNVQPYIAAAALYVIPLRVGGGTRFKALEAMACGKPIVSTSLGVEGIGVVDGQELLLADSPVAFADAVLRLLQPENEPLRMMLRRNARRFVEERYSWSTITPRLESLFERTTRTRRAIPKGASS
jgi:sugar transferase (PEP-CTERM/EpsH1 system associated)